MLQVSLLLIGESLSSVFKGSCHDLLALKITDQINFDFLGRVDINQYLLVELVVERANVPVWVHHEHVLARTQHCVLLVQERETEVAAESGTDPLTVLTHQDDVEAGGLKLLGWVSLSVVFETISLLDHRNREGISIKVDFAL